jgi:hypothetical protein
MEGTPTDPTPAEPPPAAPSRRDGSRVAAALGALVLLFVALIAVLVVVDVAGTTPCDDVKTIADLNDDGECYDRSSGVKTFVVIIGSLGALAALAAAGLAVAYLVRGRGGRLLVQATVAAVVLLGLTLIIG